MGLNPRGKEGADYTREGFDSCQGWAACDYAESKPKPHCTYVDDKWLDGRRKHRLQHRVPAVLRAVLRGLHLPDTDAAVRAIPKSCLYFSRTSSADRLRSLLELTRGAPESARMDCWSYHEQVIRLVRPRVIVCNGNADELSPYRRVQTEYAPGGKELVGARWKRGGRTKYTVIEKAPWFGRRALIVGLPHMSWNDPL